MRAAIIGCGFIGNRRARALGDCRLVAAADARLDRAQQLAASFPDCLATSQWEPVVRRDDVDLVIVSPTNDMLAAVTRTAVACGKHVLVEKPAGAGAAELAPVAEAARRAGVTVKVGFNHRFHPALQQRARVVRPRRDRAADVPPWALRPRRPARLRARVGAPIRPSAAAAKCSIRACT